MEAPSGADCSSASTSGPIREGESNERTHTATTGTKPALSSEYVALRTVPLYLTNAKRRIKVDALLDDANSRTYLNSDIAAELERKGTRPHELTVNVLNEKSLGNAFRVSGRVF